ncbi:peptidase S8/S53 domain-containing protein [Rostrohypoxylon terebratum]|nr:peptidase S8/S53 domain-containing protein [Rostrohypoxylon terebratum]
MASKFFFMTVDDLLNNLALWRAQGVTIPTAEFKSGLTPSIGQGATDIASDIAQDSVPPAACSIHTPSQPEEGHTFAENPRSIDVLNETAATFMRTDLQFAGICLTEFNDDKVSEETQTQTEQLTRKITEQFTEKCTQVPVNDSQPRGNDIKDVIKITKEVEKFVETKLQEEVGAGLESSTNDMVETRLHAGKLLTQSIGRRLHTLSMALVQQLSCCDEQHFIRLKLTGFVDQTHSQNGSDFDMYLSNGNHWARAYWVKSKCKFIGELTQEGDRGCTFIQDSVQKGKQLSLLLKETPARDPDTQYSVSPIQFTISQELSSFVTPTESIASVMRQVESSKTTQRVFNVKKFLPIDRDKLCLNLALSLLHMASSDWRRLTWYSDNPDIGTGIFFLRDPSSQEIVNKTQVYMSWRIQENFEAQNSTEGLMCNPQLLDFARLLIEIQNWTKLQLTLDTASETLRKQLFGKPHKEQLRLCLLEYINVQFEPVRYSDFKSALLACLNDRGRIEAAAENKPERIQAYVFNQIIKPLHRYFGNPELPQPTFPAKSSFNSIPLMSQNCQKSPELDTYDLSITHNPKDEELHNIFWDKMTEFLNTYIKTSHTDELNPYMRRKVRKVRIAIIDSGVRNEDIEIAAAKANKQIVGYRNFTSSDPDDCEDHINHGTMVTRLLLDVAPEAELYIAKVSNQKKLPKSQLHCIAEAIKWAVQQWDVDIISMSLTLTKVHYDIDEELNQALSPSYLNNMGKIVFAAAGNRGLYEKVFQADKLPAWPASKKGVIAVYATNGSDRRIGASPADPAIKKDLKLATLGHGIKMRWPDSENLGKFKDIYISGSSFATPIAAGTAANVLEFVNRRLEMPDFKRARFHSHDKMADIFKELSVCDKEGFNFVHPLEMWQRAYRKGGGDGSSQPPDKFKLIYKCFDNIVS